MPRMRARAAGREHQSHQQFESGGFPGAVGSEKAENLAFFDREMQAGAGRAWASCARSLRCRFSPDPEFRWRPWQVNLTSLKRLYLSSRTNYRAIAVTSGNIGAGYAALPKVKGPGLASWPPMAVVPSPRYWPNLLITVPWQRPGRSATSAAGDSARDARIAAQNSVRDRCRNCERPTD